MIGQIEGDYIIIATADNKAVAQAFPIVELTATYAIGKVPPRIAAGERVLMCRTCKRVSCNPNDVEEKYCGFCRAFLDSLNLSKT